MSKTILVIGGSAAGAAAAAKAKRTLPDSEVVMYEEGEYISTGICEMPYLFSGEIDNFEKLIFYTPEKFRTEKGVIVKTGSRVENISLREKKITVRRKADNYLFEKRYDNLIIASGSSSKKIPGLDYSLENVFTFKNMEDTVKILSYLKRNTSQKKIIILGAGYAGLELAESAKRGGYDITLIEIGKLPLPSASVETSSVIKRILDENGVRFLGEVSNLAFLTQEGKITSVNCDGRIIDADVIVSCAGFMPQSSLASSAGIKTGATGGIKTDSRLRTSDYSVFAAGDCVELINSITNKPAFIPSALFAHNYGHIAGENSAGGCKNAPKTYANLSLKLFDTFITLTGISEKEAEEYGFVYSTASASAFNLVKIMPGSRAVSGRIIYEKRNKFILGAEFLGGPEVSSYADIISLFINNKIPADKLAEANFNYAPSLSPFINLLSVLGRKIK
jgi:NADPH-dependent 2,4-dienoyl-CoA reductase/sulfur reductase-like enzyme